MKKLPAELKGELTAWFTGSMGPHSLLDEDVLSRVQFCDHDMSSVGWSLCGTASITLYPMDQDALIGSKVDSLRAELTKVRADATSRETEITQQINTLLSIGYAVEVAP